MLDQVTDSRPGGDGYHELLDGQCDGGPEKGDARAWTSPSTMRARQLSGSIQPGEGRQQDPDHGPEVPGGEEGRARCCSSAGTACSSRPLPLEDIIDPTGAGDTFAGGFMGYWPHAGPQLRQPETRDVVGSALASYCCEVRHQRLLEIDREDIDAARATVRRPGGFRYRTRGGKSHACGVYAGDRWQPPASPRY